MEHYDAEVDSVETTCPYCTCFNNVFIRNFGRLPGVGDAADTVKCAGCHKVYTASLEIPGWSKDR